MLWLHFFLFFFFNDTATTEIYTLSLHDALPILAKRPSPDVSALSPPLPVPAWPRSEEHTSELQSPCNLVCRLLLEKKKQIVKIRSNFDNKDINQIALIREPQH